MADARHFADLSAKDGSGLATEGRAASSGGAHPTVPYIQYPSTLGLQWVGTVGPVR